VKIYYELTIFQLLQHIHLLHSRQQTLGISTRHHHHHRYSITFSLANISVKLEQPTTNNNISEWMNEGKNLLAIYQTVGRLSCSFSFCYNILFIYFYVQFL
jgi:hypothetical protein